MSWETVGSNWKLLKSDILVPGAELTPGAIKKSRKNIALIEQTKQEQLKTLWHKNAPLEDLEKRVTI